MQTNITLSKNEDMIYLKDFVKELVNDGVFNLYKINHSITPEYSYFLMGLGKYYFINNDGVILNKNSNRPNFSEFKIMQTIHFKDKIIPKYIDSELQIERYFYENNLLKA